MDLTELNTALISLLVLAIGIIGPITIRIVSRFVDQFGARLIDKFADDQTRTRLQLAKDEVGTAVATVAQTLLPEIREATADGKITAEEAAHLRSRAIEIAKSRFGAAFWTNLMERLGLSADDLDKWLVGLVEAHVFWHKQGALTASGSSVELSLPVGET